MTVMRTQSLMTVIGLGACVVLAWFIYDTRQQIDAVANERKHIEATVKEAAQQIADTQRDIATVAAQTSERRQLILATLPAAERMRNVVGPLLARIKEEHLRNPPPAPEPPPPFPPNGSFFPELMGDPEYSQCVKEWYRLIWGERHRKRLTELGLTAEKIGRVVDLIAEKEMVQQDFRSLLGENASTVDAQRKQREARENVMREIEQTMGAEAFDRFLESVPHPNVRIGPGGTRTETVEYTREFPMPSATKRDQIGQLERRLSYSNEPLTDGQATRIVDATLRSGRYVPAYSDAMREFLTPGQQFAIDELQAEQEASRRRSKLPKVETTPSRK